MKRNNNIKTIYVYFDKHAFDNGYRTTTKNKIISYLAASFR